MATFTPFDPRNGDPADLVDAITPNNSGISLVPGSARFTGADTKPQYPGQPGANGNASSAAFYDGSIQNLGSDAGILLTSGDGTPPQSNNLGNYSHIFVNGGTQSDPDLDAVANNAFQGSGKTRDVTYLEFKFTADDNLAQKGVQFDLVFGSDEFPEFTDSSFVDVAGAFVNGQNTALFNQKQSQPLSIISKNLNVGNFRDNANASQSTFPTQNTKNTPKVNIPIEYDGVSSRVKVVAPVKPGENTVKMGVGDTGDQIYDSGLFVSNFQAAETGGEGLLATVPGTDGDDALQGSDNNEFLDAGAGNDTLDPGGGNDVVDAGAGDDTITGGNGDNNIDGGPGVDTVAYDAAAAELPTVVVEGGDIQVGQNTDILANVEKIRFSDQTIEAADITGKDLLAKIYIGYYGRAPDPDGLDFWLDQLKTAEQQDEARGKVLDDIANSFAGSEEAQARFPFLGKADPSDAEIESFVASVYENLFNRTPDPAGKTFWRQQIADELASGGTPGAIILDMVSGSQNTAESIDATTVQNKARAALRYADTYAGDDNLAWDKAEDLSAAQTIVDGVGEAQSSLDNAVSQIENLGGGASVAALQPAGTGDVDGMG